LGADYVINPVAENFSETVLEITKGMGASIYLEATGMNMLPMMTKTITLDKVTDNSVMLRTDREEAKITCIA